MEDNSGNVIIYNGEIYNYMEIMEEIHKNYKINFKSKSDTEVILKGYNIYGNDIFKKIRGPFSIIIYNKNDNKILFARDTFGMKPLYFFEDDNSIYFSSNVKAISHITKLKTFDEAKLLFNKYGFIPEPYTQYYNVKSVEPGFIHSFCLDKQKILKEEFLTLEGIYKEVVNNIKKNQKNKLQKLSKIFSESVKSHLVADVPLSIFLSSGFDSTLVALFSAINDITAITIGFQSSEKDMELEDSSEICKKLRIKSSQKLFSDSEVMDSFKNYLKNIDVPTTDGFNVYLISRMANKYGFKVALSGIGGDEILGSYPSFKQIPIILKYKRIIDFLINFRLSSSLLKLFLPKSINFAKLKKISSIKNNIIDVYKFKRSFMTDDELFENIDEKTINNFKNIDNELIKIPDELLKSKNKFLMISYLESVFYLRSQLLRDADNFSMSNSVELRTPFVDIEVFRKALSITMFSKNNKIKYSNIIPRDILENVSLKQKKSFTTNVYEVFAEKNGFIGDYKQSLNYTSKYIYDKT